MDPGRRLQGLYFRDALDHLLRADGHVDAYNELRNSALTAHLALLGRQQNNDMSKISSWDTIIAVPTAITGIYGMNFDYMPELRWLFGNPIMLTVVIVAIASVYDNSARAADCEGINEMRRIRFPWPIILMVNCYPGRNGRSGLSS